jgi:recombination protein RecR
VADSGAAAVERLIALMARLPGLGPRSARRAALAMIRKRTLLLDPLAAALAEVAETVRECRRCGNVATAELCGVCADPGRATGEICVVETVADLWAMERAGAFRGRYHVLGGVLSALDGVGPEALRIPELAARVREEGAREVILALNATVDGQTTAHYIADTLEPMGVAITTLAKGVPVGGELDYLDDGTIGAAFAARRRV